ncbi:hypothetical protein F9K50_11285, partial [bacterium]
MARRRLIAVAALVFSACARFDASQTVALVDGVAIPARELQQVLRREKEKFPPEKLKSSGEFLKIKEKVLGELIDRKLLLKEATAQGTFISEEEFQDELLKYKS